ncbi:MAG: hypothetical protein ACXWF5_14515 [Actinomycetota bacterium]
MHAGIDGEAVDLIPVLEFVIQPAALRVRTSSRHQGVSLARRLSPPHPAAHRRPSGLMGFQQET